MADTTFSTSNEPTNDSVQALIDEFGPKIRALKSSSWIIPINQSFDNTPIVKHTDIVLVNIGGVDYIKIQRTVRGTKYYQLCATSKLEAVIATEDDNGWIDPYVINQI